MTIKCTSTQVFIEKTGESESRAGALILIVDNYFDPDGLEGHQELSRVRARLNFTSAFDAEEQDIQVQYVDFT